MGASGSNGLLREEGHPIRVTCRARGRRCCLSQLWLLQPTGAQWASPHLRGQAGTGALGQWGGAGALGQWRGPGPWAGCSWQGPRCPSLVSWRLVAARPRCSGQWLDACAACSVSPTVCLHTCRAYSRLCSQEGCGPCAPVGACQCA